MLDFKYVLNRKIAWQVAIGWISQDNYCQKPIPLTWHIFRIENTLCLVCLNKIKLRGSDLSQISSRPWCLDDKNGVDSH